MSTNFRQLGKSFSSVRTGDGSPTALGPTGEPMHSLQGALTETLYIYGPVADKVFANGWPPRFLSLGLGLGYVEMMTVARGLRSLASWDRFYLHSFESEDFLRDQMAEFLEGSADSHPLYRDVLNSTALEHDLEADTLFKKLGELRSQGKWILDGALHANSPRPAEKFSGIFFDAFSNKSTPELWAEDFLDFFLDNFAGPDCILRTYAVTGTLKRALRAHRFEVSLIKGFAKKRESTEAVRAVSS